MRFSKARQYFWNQVELIEIDLVPWYDWVWLQAGLALLTLFVNRLINILQFALHDIRNQPGPDFICFSQSYRVGMTWPAVSAQRFVRQFSDVRTAHDYRNARSSHCISHSISLGYHPRHGADADQSDTFFLDITHQFLFIHRLGVAVDQDHLMLRRSQGLQQKHPEMRHEISSDTVIRVVK